MKVFLIASLIFLIYKLLKAKFGFEELKKDAEYHLFKIEQEFSYNLNNPLVYAKRGAIYLVFQDFYKASIDFHKALLLYNQGMKLEHEGKPVIMDDFEDKIKLNIKYSKKPYYWVKNGPKDMSNNWFAYFIIERFGNKRYNF